MAVKTEEERMMQPLVVVAEQLEKMSIEAPSGE